MTRVILTLSTVPNRLSETREDWGTKVCIDKLLSLSYQDYEIHFNIPEIQRSTGEEYIIPDWLKNIKDPRLKVFRTEDYGPITKISPTVFRVDDPNAVIITLDDDLLYEDGFIEYHLKKMEEYPNSVIAFAGISAIDQSCHFCTSVQKDTRVKIVEGYKTVSYRRSFFENDFFTEFVGKHWADDIVLSAYIGKRNIPKIVVAYDKEIDYTPRVESFPIIKHLPVEAGGCNIFRARNTQKDNDVENEFYRLGYLER